MLAFECNCCQINLFNEHTKFAGRSIFMIGLTNQVSDDCSANTLDADQSPDLPITATCNGRDVTDAFPTLDTLSTRAEDTRTFRHVVIT